MNRYEQYNWVMERLRDFGIRCEKVGWDYRTWIGNKRYDDVFSATIAGIKALQAAKVVVPPEVLTRPDCLLEEDRKHELRNPRRAEMG